MGPTRRTPSPVCPRCGRNPNFYHRDGVCQLPPRPRPITRAEIKDRKARRDAIAADPSGFFAILRQLEASLVEVEDLAARGSVEVPPAGAWSVSPARA